jgi:purine-binding chemotaxis protein CheW
LDADEPITTPEAPSVEVEPVVGDDAVRLAIEQAFGSEALSLLDGGDAAAGGGPRLDELIAEIDREQEALGPPSHLVAEAAGRRLAAATRKFVVFVLADTHFAVPLEDVLEIQRLPRITTIPSVPDWVLGVTNLRGEILSVVDLRALLGIGDPGHGPGGLIMVVRSSDQELTTALVVDRVPGMTSLPPDRIVAPTSAVDARISPYMRGVAEDRDRLLVVLDLDELLLSREMRQFQQA